MESLFSLANRKILVTGGAQGIGKAVAFRLAEAGANVGILDRNGEGAQSVADELKLRFPSRNFAGFVCDVTDYEAVNRTVDDFVRCFDGIDGLFNNAGTCIHKEVENVTPEEWLRVVNVNYNGLFYVAQAVGKRFIATKTKGTIVNTGSMSGVIINLPQPQTSYNSSKAAVIHLTKSLAVEWAQYGIRVNCISPGYIKTELSGMAKPEWIEYWLQAVPFHRMGLPDELAGAVIYFMSEASTYTSGANLIIDGCFTST
ncbi:MAG TPA: SDR family oxidoreductase [Candidatus Pullichristensenella avicola]|nr:SDR family oxidoreductase [Candidatus Pullichristensenella avicola]